MLSPQAIQFPDAELERGAFNAAFHELGLRWHWDARRYDALCAEPSERERVQRYIETDEPHLLHAYEASFLADAVLEAKERHLRAFSKCGAAAQPRFGWADPRWGETGV